MRSKKILKAALSILLLTAICAGLLPVHAQAKTEKIRVGFYEKEDYHTIDRRGRHGGYDYEYLNKIAYYTGWEYEFVTATWEECLEMLKNGQLDLLGGVEWSREREEYMFFPEVSSMSVVNCLFQSAGSDKYSFEDFDSYDGMRVGILAGSNQVNTLQTLSQEKGFSYIPMPYDTETEMRQALESGQVDCLYMDNCRDLSGYSILCYHNYAPLYYVTTKVRPEVGEALEYALEEIRIREPAFEYNLYSKYFEYAQNISLTREEREYVKNSPPIQVGLNMEIGTLLCRWDNEKQRYVGLIPDTMEMLSQRTGLEFVYEPIPEACLPAEYLDEHRNSVMAPAMISSLIKFDRGFQLLSPIYKGKMLTITQSGAVLDTNESFTLAVPTRLYAQQDKLGKIFPNAKLVSCRSHRAGMEMVASGQADIAMVNEFTAAYELQSPFFEKLKSANLSDITEDVTLGLSYDADPELISILSKGIRSLSERDTRDIILKNTAAVSYEVSLNEFLYSRRYTVILVGVFFLGILFFFNQRKRYLEGRKRDRKSLIAAEERLRADAEYQKIMFHQANFDELTDLYNQKYFIEKANELMAANPDKIFRFLWINIKGFRMLNDLYGGEAGDEVLRSMAECLRTCIGGKGVYGRMYADRFAVCIPRDCEIDFADKCIRKVPFEGKNLRIRVAIGVYEDGQGCRDAARCMNYALIALQSRSAGDASPVSYFNITQLDMMRTKQMITNDMERALEEEQFKVYLQPQYDLKSKQLVGAEALARWVHPEQGMIPPSLFIPVFENNRFIYRLSAYMCDHVCRLLAQWLAEGKAVPVSVNLSQLDLANPKLIPMLLDTLNKYKVPTQYLRLEITESAYADNQQRAIDIIDKLRSLGFRMEIDDFGSGYSSLNMLKEVTVDAVKLDMRFLSKGTNLRRASLIVDFVVQMIHSIGMSVIVEGVETEQDAAFLSDIGCRYVQGYLYGRPMPSDDFAACLAGSTLGEKM